MWLKTDEIYIMAGHKNDLIGIILIFILWLPIYFSAFLLFAFFVHPIDFLLLTY